MKKSLYFTPGPAQLYPTVIKHFQKGFDLQIPSISHRGKQFSEIFADAATGLKKLLLIPDDYHIFFVGSATEAMERTIQNCVEKYSWHFVNGSFSKRFFVTAEELGKQPLSSTVDSGLGFDFKHIAIPDKTELICFTHNETSTGVMLPTKEIEKMAKHYTDMLVAVDIVSSVPYVDLDYRLLDVVFFSVQKGFGLPAGLGVMIVSPRAIEKSEKLLEKGISVGSYRGFSSLLAFANKNQTLETPPVLEMYVLGKVIKDMQRKGIEVIRKETDEKAEMLYDFFDHSDVFSAVIRDKKFRSRTVILADIQKVKGNLEKILLQKGFIVGSGYGIHKNTQIRIANFPTHSISDMKRLIKALKAV
ncbi:MAG TPA: aminotransferase class V-fold PLP-dependent enzyme [Candidatus Saccharimonadales bacterium]|nr:aminotransferase class V-fold PLP-dependent enzyme [Candidatus Saccharimonadales bacterium]